MVRWKEGSREFAVRVISHESRGYHTVTIPGPVMEALGEPERITFKIKEQDRVEVEAVEDNMS
ncbi:MAG: hypothetical protein JRN20_22080 [Nitrososphaerota archaeon]|nr:hypothetical protein [Nitrososphaerota archaeon]